jgi:hypothetical protein
MTWLGEFDPDDGATVLAPEGTGPGHWVGAASLATDGSRLLVAYRDRRPDRRGHRCVIAARDADGMSEIWSAPAAAIDTVSIERPALIRAAADRWHLYYSYVEADTGRWQVDVSVADDPAAFDLTAGQPVVTATSTGTEGVKDPYVIRVDGIWFLFVNAVLPAAPGAARPRDGVGGDVVLPTGVATSLDGLEFSWDGIVLPVGGGWDARMARLTSIVPGPRGFLGFYDGRATAEQNFEEQLGLAHSFDLRHWSRLTPRAPHRRSPHGGGALRYLDTAVVDGDLVLVYEYARPDGSHELRENRVPWPND